MKVVFIPLSRLNSIYLILIVYTAIFTNAAYAVGENAHEKNNAVSSHAGSLDQNYQSLIREATMVVTSTPELLSPDPYLDSKTEEVANEILVPSVKKFAKLGLTLGVIASLVYTANTLSGSGDEKDDHSEDSMIFVNPVMDQILESAIAGSILGFIYGGLTGGALKFKALYDYFKKPLFKKEVNAEIKRGTIQTKSIKEKICPVCLEDSDPNEIYAELKCGHQLCLNCYKELHTHALNRRCISYKINCPLCRKQLKLTENIEIFRPAVSERGDKEEGQNTKESGSFTHSSFLSAGGER